MKLRVAKKIAMRMGPGWDPGPMRWNQRTLMRALYREVRHLSRLRRMLGRLPAGRP